MTQPNDWPDSKPRLLSLPFLQLGVLLQRYCAIRMVTGIQDHKALIASVLPGGLDLQPRCRIKSLNGNSGVPGRVRAHCKHSHESCPIASVRASPPAPRLTGSDDVPQLLNPLMLAPNVVVIESALPNRRGRRLVPQVTHFANGCLPIVGN